MGADRARRMTPQRQVVLEELRSFSGHPTADELYERVRRRIPRISLGTVYRNLETLVSEKIIQKLDIYGTQKRFDCHPEAHYHARCLRCGSIRDATLTGVLPTALVHAEPGEFMISGVRLEFVGYCASCMDDGRGQEEGVSGPET